MACKHPGPNREFLFEYEDKNRKTWNRFRCTACTKVFDERA